MKHSQIFLYIMLLAFNAAIIIAFPKLRFSRIVVHHSASEHDNLKSIRAFHKNKFNWEYAGYHLIISNGKAGVPAGHIEPTGRYSQLIYSLATKNPFANTVGLHICIVGNYEKHDVPAALRPAVGNALVQIMKRFGLTEDDIFFHHDVGKTVCPGKHITKTKLASWIRNSAPKCPKSTRLQQINVLSSPFSPALIPLSGWLVLLALDIVITRFWFGSTKIFSLLSKNSSQKSYDDN